MAKVFGVADRTIQRMVKEGMPQAARGAYDIRACVQWQLAELERNDAASGGMTPRDELAIAQRRKVELETEQLRLTLVPREMAERAMNEIAAIIASQLDGLGPRLAGELADSDDPAWIQARLFTETRTLRASIAQAIKNFGATVKTGEAFEGEDNDEAA